MAEKVTKRGAISPTRKRLQLPKVIIASRFSVRKDKISIGYIDFLFEPVEKGLPTEKVTFDISIFKTNLSAFKEYAVGLNVEERDEALSDDLPYLSGGLFANMLHLTQTAGRAETAFGVVSLNEWVQAGFKAHKENTEVSVETIDTISVFSDAAFQKKFVLELILAIENIKP
jgi:hypothetical protein